MNTYTLLFIILLLLNYYTLSFNEGYSNKINLYIQ